MTYQKARLDLVTFTTADVITTSRIGIPQPQPGSHDGQDNNANV